MVFYLSAEWFDTAYRLFGLRDGRSPMIVFCQVLSKYFAFFEGENRVFSFAKNIFCYSASTEAQNMQ